LRSRDATSLATALVTKVFLGLATFPAVIRSDNALENLSETIAEMNRMLEIRHITGSAYHPQSQGMVERMHQTLNAIMRGLVQDHPEDWEDRVPFV
jgi:transposase InsO family protein